MTTVVRRALLCSLKDLTNLAAGLRKAGGRPSYVLKYVVQRQHYVGQGDAGEQAAAH